jgi:hypothetical protein
MPARAQAKRLEELRARAEAAEAELRALKREAARAAAAGGGARRALAGAEAAAEALAAKRADLLEAARMEEARRLSPCQSCRKHF